MTWEVFKATFIDRFFPREMMEENVTEFISLRQEEKSVHEYSLEFVKLSKYSPSLVFNSRDQIGHFVTGFSEDFKK